MAEQNFRPHVTCTRRMPDNRFVLVWIMVLTQVKITVLMTKEQKLVNLDAIRCDAGLRDISVTVRMESLFI